MFALWRSICEWIKLSYIVFINFFKDYLLSNFILHFNSSRPSQNWLQLQFTGGYIKTQKRKTKKILSDKIVRFREDFLRFPGKFPVFGVVTLLPGVINWGLAKWGKLVALSLLEFQSLWNIFLKILYRLPCPKPSDGCQSKMAILSFSSFLTIFCQKKTEQLQKKIISTSQPRVEHLFASQNTQH